MPTYEYLCQTCSHRFETWQKMADEPLTTCPECGSQIHRILFPTGIVFKGHGFYKTDYNSNGNSVATNSDGDNKQSETSSNDTTKQSETSSNDTTKQSETSSNGATKPPETSSSKSTTASNPTPPKGHGLVA